MLLLINSRACRRQYGRAAEIGAPESDIDKLLRDDDVRKLHDLTYSAIIRYFTKIQPVRRNYTSDEEFVKRPYAGRYTKHSQRALQVLRRSCPG